MSEAQGDDSKPRVLVCRGCCCGSSDKHPGFDHERQIETLSSVAPTKILDCVSECARSNVVIVRPKPAELVWFGEITTDDLTDELCRWIEAGAPQPLPPALDERAFLNAAKQKKASRSRH